MQARTPDHRTIKHAHLFCGLGGGARGFNQATARVGTLEADFRCLGGIDVDPQANLPIWVEPMAVALSVRQPDETPGVFR